MAGSESDLWNHARGSVASFSSLGDCGFSLGFGPDLNFGYSLRLWKADVERQLKVILSIPEPECHR